MDENLNFQIFLENLSEHYTGVTVRELRMLLYGILPIGDLDQSHIALELFNKLTEHGFISKNNVELLSDIAEVTNLASARECITEYKNIIQCTKTVSPLTEYRRALFRALKNVGKGDLKKVTGFYKLRAFNYDNIWDSVYHIEKAGRLDSQQKIEVFAKLLNKVTQHILLAKPYQPAVIQTSASTPTSISTGNQKSKSKPTTRRPIGTEKRKHYRPIHNEHWISSSCKKHITICTALAIGILIIAIPNIFSYPSHYFESQVLDHKRKGTESTTKYSEITESKKESKTKFQTLNADLSRYYEGERYYWLRFCLIDYLSVSDITDAIGNDLFNALQLKGLITPTNVSLLLEITKLTEVKPAENLIKEYMKDNKLQNYDDTMLSDDRKRLFKAMRQVDTDALKRLVSYYNLKHHNLQNIWNVVYKLEIEVLAKDPYRIKKIHEKLVGNY
ncbi:uncharacterized protein [Antedon mediterranea]|uniref:uncharacterized protein n=1 Tax=Antedon mediterranea TaxID=105859 RepID=UPI003AF5E6D4